MLTTDMQGQRLSVRRVDNRPVLMAEDAKWRIGESGEGCREEPGRLAAELLYFGDGGLRVLRLPVPEKVDLPEFFPRCPFLADK